MTSAENEKVMKVIDEWAEGVAKNIKIMEKVFSGVKELLGAVHGAFNGSRLSYSPSLSGVEDDVYPLPRIEDSMPEAMRNRQLEALKCSIQRRRKLSVEDMLDIYILHTEKKASFRSIAKKFNVSEFTIRKTFKKVAEILDKVADKENSWTRVIFV